MMAGALSVVLVSAGLLSGCQTSSDGAAVSQPNILFILVDDLGYKAVPPYGNPHQDLSNLDRLAEEGMTFMDAYVTPQCTPTRAALMTGQHTARNKMWHVIAGYGFPYAKMREPKYRENLPRETYTMAEALQDNGYRTAQLGKWHLNTYEQGDGYYTYLFDDAKEYYGFDYVTPMQEPSEYHQRGDKGVRMLTNEAMGFMERSQAKEQPFFIYLAHHTIHGPVLAPDSLVQKYQELGYPDSTLPDRYNVDAPTNAEYLGALKHLDNSIGRLTDKIEELGIEDNTMVVFLSDNGASSERPSRYGPGFDRAGAFGGDAQVAGEGEFAPAAERVAVDRRDGHPGERLDGVGDAVAEFGVGLRLRRREVLHVADVRAGDERLLARAGEDEHAGVLRLGFRECLFDGFEGVDVQRVQALRAVDGQGGYRVVHVEGDGVPLHDWWDAGGGCKCSPSRGRVRTSIRADSRRGPGRPRDPPCSPGLVFQAEQVRADVRHDV